MPSSPPTLLQKWVDSRCLYRPLRGMETETTLQGHGLEDLHNLVAHLWMPDTFIANARSVDIQCGSIYPFLMFTLVGVNTWLLTRQHRVTQ
jgi:hypothetical protein